ncbi:hypothetical protein V2I01_00740 [Micromonospora sp. BRA006-A]|nr:hypothetical protein [Micromonospora sp. BRA006-A]
MKDLTEQAVQTDLDRVVRRERDSRAGHPAGPAEAVGDVRVERAGVGDVPAHRGVAGGEDGEHGGEEHVSERGADVAADRVHGGDTTAENGQRGGRGDGEEDEVSGAETTAAQPTVGEERIGGQGFSRGGVRGLMCLLGTT